MSSIPSPDEIARDARWLVQALDPGAGLVRLVEMTPEAYRAASFLDDRMLQQPVNAQLMPWTDVVSAISPSSRRDARWIFHIGHVGSTLVARLLGELDGVLSIREPRMPYDLTFFAKEVRDRYVPNVRALLSRTFRPDQTALVKATSFVSEIAAELVPKESSALFMYARPRAFITGLLAGENSARALETMRESRARRMSGRVGAMDESGKSVAHLAAAAWACEITALEAAAEQMKNQPPVWADFDRMLDDLEGSLTGIAGFLGFQHSPGEMRKIASSPLIGRYSKDPSYDFSPALRGELLAKADQEFRTDIDSALVMLARAANTSPLLTRALERSNSER